MMRTLIVAMAVASTLLFMADQAAADSAGAMNALSSLARSTGFDGVATALLKRAAKDGDADAAYELGIRYANGDGVEVNPRQAARWYRVAVDHGSAAAASNLGVMFEKGVGVKADPAKAVGYYRFAAERGDAAGQHNLGHAYLVGVHEHDLDEGVRWMTLAARQGFSQSRIVLGALFMMGVEGIEVADAEPGLKLMADQGEPRAMFVLGELARIGALGQADPHQALDWYRAAGAAGDPDGYVYAGKMLAYGMGVERDVAAAGPMLEAAANAGSTDAQTTLGALLLEAGMADRAIHWLTLAADGGEDGADLVLGALYASDEFVPRDPERAFRHLALADVSKVEGMAELRDRLRAELGERRAAEIESEATETLFARTQAQVAELTESLNAAPEAAPWLFTED